MSLILEGRREGREGGEQKVRYQSLEFLKGKVK